jgi:hypothetical protein
MATSKRRRTRGHARRGRSGGGRSRSARWLTRSRAIAITATVLGIAVVSGIVVGILLLAPIHPAPPKPHPIARACPDVVPVAVGRFVVPAGPVAGFCQPALINAAKIIEAGESYNVTVHAQEVGVMTAIGESRLQNLNYGDVAGPDSRGLFQQRKNWGSIKQRMDPYTASRAFFSRLIGVAHYNQLPPTKVAHLIQGNANPDYYTPYFPAAVTIVTALRDSGTAPSTAPTP